MSLQDLLELINSGANILLHSFGGSGKSHMIRELVETIGDTKVIYQTALTGVAALGLNTSMSSASTLHRWSGIGLGKGSGSELLKRIASNKKFAERWEDVEILVVDEISMLGKELFEKLDYIARRIRDARSPFGGIQVIFSGDFLQLPPVCDEWVFTSSLWKQLDLQPLILYEPKRFNDEKFFKILMDIRKGIVTDETRQILLKRVIPPPPSKIQPTILYSTKKDTIAYNIEKLDGLKYEEHLFVAQDFVRYRGGKGAKSKDPKIPIDEDFVEEHGEANVKSCMDILQGVAPKELILKVGAQVLLKYNVDYDDGLVNGSRGVVDSFDGDKVPVVLFVNGKKRKIPSIVWEYSSGDVILLRQQIPLILAWSCTIHNVQGSTLDYVMSDIGNEIFCPGQAYVALSRVRNLDGLFLKSFVPQKIRADKKALEYVDKIERQYEERQKSIAGASTSGDVDRELYKSLFDMVVTELRDIQMVVLE